MTGNEVRSKFLDYFKTRDHQIVRSSSLVPQDDPTLLFVNAGMVQFKRTFLGEEKRKYSRAATSQKCVRAGGKHNDLENVGYTARHHTFFEMLGNFSFGDYFKEKAIEYSWDLLTEGFGLASDKLWVSVFIDDDEAADLWGRVVGLPEKRIVRLGKKDNFWSMGETGPCGPCSEILIDRGEGFSCGRPDCSVGCDCDRYLEIWNLVFMQFNRDGSGIMTPLPKPSIDTGMGLERITSLIQGAPTNYETDLLLPIIRRVEELSLRQAGDSAAGDVAMKVIADHSRAAAFLIGDGVMPSNEGRGYVLRRILRRAIRYGRSIGLIKPFLHVTTGVVFDIMRQAYPELAASSAFISKVIENEELRFLETLDNGLKLLNETLADLKAKGEKCIPGRIIFKLYDTYGFPVDIVRDVVRDEGMVLDMEGFDEAMDRQRERSKTVIAFSRMSDAYRDLTRSGLRPEFTGYDRLSTTSKVLVITADSRRVEEASTGAEVDIVTEATPFYGESGGQVGDTGVITGPDLRIEVTDTIKDPTGLLIHRGRVVSGTVKTGEPVTLSVDLKKRQATALNHTATHLLHAALRQVLGDHVKQSGSFVSSERLRFDFTHFASVDPEDLDRIEMLVNARIRENVVVQIEEMEADAALQSGATALFEEKYGDRVRVITLGDFSKELCGGTHTGRTGNIGLFKIVGESSVAAGVRRVEALTGQAALSYMQRMAGILRQSARLLKENPDALVRRIEQLLAAQKSLEKTVDQLKAKIASASTADADEDIRSINDIRVLVKKVSADSPAALRELADRLRDKIKSGIIVIGGVEESKALLVAVVTKDLAGRYHAGKIIKEVAGVVGGSGGGRPDMAQAGGPLLEKLDEALEKAYEVIKKA